MERYNNNFHSERNSPLKVSQLERKWQRILEEERQSYSRNKTLLEDFDRVEQQIELFSRKSNSLKHAKHAFETYVSTVYPKWNRELKRLREAKNKNASKEYKQRSSVSDVDFLTEKEHSANLMSSDPRGTQITNPAFSSTPYINGVQDHQDPARLSHSVGNEQPMPGYHGEHLPYGQYPGNHHRMDYGHNWSLRDGLHPAMFDHVPRYSLPRQSFNVPWRNIPYEGHPSYMLDPNAKMGNFHQVFPQNSGQYQADPAFSGNTSEERFREFQNWDKRFGNHVDTRSHREDNGGQQTHNSGEVGTREHQDIHQRDGEYHDRFQRSKSLSEEQLIKERLNHARDLKCSPGVKDMVDNDQLNQDGHDNEKTSFEHGKNTGKTTKDRKLDHGVVSKVNLGVSARNGKEDISMESYIGNSGGTDTSSEMRTEAKDYKEKEMTGTDSISLPTIYNFEGNLKDFYSSDTEQVSDAIAAACATSEPRGGLRPGTDPEVKEVGNTTIKESKKKESAPSPQADVVNYVETTRRKETTVLDDLLGDDLSDFEVSDLEDSDDFIDDKALLTNTEISKNVPQELGSSTPDDAIDDKALLTNTEISRNVSQKLGNPTPDTEHKLVDSKAKSEVTIPISTNHSSPRETLITDEVKSRTTTRTDLNSQDKEVSPIEKEQRIEPSQDESVSQKSSPRDDETALSDQDTDENVIFVDEETLVALLQVVDDDIEVSFSTELLYRHDDCTTQQKLDILRAAKSCESFEKFDPAAITMVLLDQLPHFIRTSDKGCLISHEILANENNYLHEKDFREDIDVSLVVLWQKLFSHFLKIIQNNVMNAEQIADIFAPCFVSSESSSVDKAINLVSRILSSPQETINVQDHAEELSTNEQSLSRKEDNKEKSESGILEELSFSSEESISERVSSVNRNNRNTSEIKSETRENISYSENFEDEKSIPLTETDAYQKMLSSIKVSDEEDIEEDLLEGTMSEANTSGQQKQDYIHPSEQQAVHHSSNSFKNPIKTSKSKPKLSLFSSGEVDELGNSFDHEGGLGASWKSSEVSMSPPLSPDLDMGGYVATIADIKNGQRKDSGVKEPDELPKSNQVKPGTQGSNTKSRIQAGFWNHSDTESEVDLQVSHGAEGNNDDDDDDFDFYS